MRRDHLLKIPTGKGAGAHAKSEKAEYGDGFTKANLYNFTEFYKAFPEIFHPASGNSTYGSAGRTTVLVCAADPRQTTLQKG